MILDFLYQYFLVCLMFLISNLGSY